jgi:4-hydroxy-2-oxoheptanedioate aldolase
MDAAMRPNRIREIWAKGESAISGWLSIGNSYSAEIVGYSGVDCVTIDLQHGMIDMQDLFGMLQAVSASPSVPFVRVPSCDPPLLMKALDAGAYGVICPMIESVSQAELFVQATRYPPKGSRSFGPARGLLYGGVDYLEKADNTIVRFAMIETETGLASLEGICSVDGLDGIFVGPSDLGLSLKQGVSLDPSSAAVSAAIEHCRVTAKSRGLHTGIFCASGRSAAVRAAEGFDFLVPNSDANLLKLILASEVKAARHAITPAHRFDELRD